MPSENAAPMIRPSPATIKMVLRLATLAPRAGPTKFTASLMTPTMRLPTAMAIKHIKAKSSNDGIFVC